VIASEGVEEEKILGVAETIFDDIVASRDVVGDDSGDLVKRYITYEKSPYKFGDIFI
jgi:hypothetical protein